METTTVPLLILLLVLVLVLVLFVSAARKASRRSEERIAALEAELEVAKRPSVAPSPEDVPAAHVPPRAGPASAGREGPELAGDALARISDFLRHAVAAPLREGLDRDDAELRELADEALAALEDMDFFAEEREDERHPANLYDLLQDVAEEYSEESDVMVKFRDGDTTLRASVAPEAFKDAVYLVLANAGIFGRGNPVEVTVESAGGDASIRFRDHGPGFTDEALRRGTEPFYTTEEGALGMGLTHAARTLEAQGGELLLGNSPRGGAEVELRLPKL